MKLTWRDLIATVVVTAVAVPYVGYLVHGEMPLIDDPRGMAGIGLLLGVVAVSVWRFGEDDERFGTAELVVLVASLVLGVVALVLAETAAAEVMLAVFMVSLLLVWMVELADHAGRLPGHPHSG